MIFSQKIGNYHKTNITTSQIILKNTIALIPLYLYFSTINIRILNILIINVSTFLLMEIIYNKIKAKKQKNLSLLTNNYLLFNSILLSFIIPPMISVLPLIIIDILSYIIYKIIRKKYKREVVSLIAIVIIFLLLFNIDLNNSLIYMDKIDYKLLFTYIITIIYLCIIKYQINISYYLAIYTYLFITFLLTKNISVLITALNPIYIILTLFIINNNNMLNPTSYGRSLIGLLTAFTTIILIDFNIKYYELFAFVIVSILNPYIDSFMLKYNFNKQIKKVSPIILVLSIILISTI